MAADLSASESMVRALQAGFQVRQQREDHEKQLEHEKLQQMVMKLQMDQMKAGAAQREYELKQKHAEGMFAAMQGQPAANFATQIPTAPANALPGVTLPQTGGAETVPTGPRPVQFPGLPEELGGGPGFAATPQTAEELIAQSRRAALEKEFNTGVNVPQVGRVFQGEVTQPAPPPVVRPTAPVRPVAVQTMENGKRVTKYLPPDQATGQTFEDQPPRPTAAVAGAGGSDNVKEAVAGMKEGTLPPILPGRASKDYIALLSEARRQGYDLAGAATDWQATQKHIATMNGAQQLRLNQAVNALPEMLDTVDTLASKWKGGRFPVLNRANLALAKGGAFGQDVASLANQLDAQIADVTADLGNVYMGGNSPTDHALGLAAKSLSGDWSEKVLHDMVKLAKGNVQIRRNSINNTGVAGASATNPYAAPPAADAGGRQRVKGPNGESGTVPAGTALPAGWTVIP